MVHITGKAMQNSRTFQVLLKTYTTVFKDYILNQTLKSNFINDGLIEQINKYQIIMLHQIKEQQLYTNFSLH